MTLRNRLKVSALALCATVSLGAEQAQAAYVVNMVQSGANVVATGSGSLDLSALTSFNNSILGISASAGVRGAPAGYIGLGINAVAASGYQGITGPATFGTGSPLIAASSSIGAAVGLNANFSAGQPLLVVPLGYVSTSLLGTSTATWNGATIASLNLTPGTYVWSWGAGATADTFTLNIGSASNPGVPEPATWASMLLGLGLTGFAMRQANKAKARVLA